MSEKKIAVLGLGYVGLPLALELSLSLSVKGFDVNNNRINQLRKGIDLTLEVDKKKLISQQKKKKLFITNSVSFLKDCNVFIATVPTPIDSKKKPDFRALLSVCRIIGPLLKKKDIVVFESTVFPGATEEICGPELERNSDSLKCGFDFFLGYSPERVNPGDKIHTIDKINKVVAGQNKVVEKELIKIYSKLTKGKIFLAKNIKVAEASKVIENSQRDINIAFINEVSKICSKINISTYDVLEASLTKWNFLNFEPGLVGGHCIGVDPYYLAEKAESLKIKPQVILSGRQTNDDMVKFIGKEISKKIKKNSKILFLGLTFKEDVPDLRNSKSIDLVNFLKTKKYEVTFFDPYIQKLKGLKSLNITKAKKATYDSIVLSVPHSFFLKELKKKFLPLLKLDGILFDIKGKFRSHSIRNYWSL
ncbi:MAG: nucleotide sugar dehydrogenase [Pseudomonadota bacterium]|nr:nucleotide sugar dehydrogenase [Pseudomonadota bacterium]